MNYKSYTDLDVWQQSRQLVNYIYGISRLFPKEEVYGLTSQMRRSVVSVPSNIAEGCGRQHAKDSLQFFFISRGSLFEIETQLYLSFDQGYVIQDELERGLEMVITCKKLLNGFINYFQTLK